MNILHAPGNGRSARSSRPAIALFSVMLACAGIAIPATADNTTSPATQNQVYKIGGDVSAPKVIYKVEPEYTTEARNAKINGTVILSLTINSSGKPGDIKVVRSLDAGLDQNAIAAVSVWRFAPAMKNNRAVSVHANIEVNFRLK